MSNKQNLNLDQRGTVFGRKPSNPPPPQQINRNQGAGSKQTTNPPAQVPQQPAQQSSVQQRQEELDREPTLQPTGAEGEEEMPATERDLADDAPWKRIQQNTFTRWANEHLKTINKNIGNLETDLSDGLRLIGLVEVLSGKKLPRHNKRPTFRSQKLENVSVALNFLQEDENIKLVNIDSSDIVDGKLKLILGLIWTLILHYSISMPMWADEDEGAKDLTPKQRLLRWIQNKVPDLPITNFTSDWNDGRAVGALVDAVAPGLCPDWADWSPKNAKANATEAMKLAEDWLGVPQLIRPEEMIDPNIDDLSMMTYLSQYPNAKLKPGAPLHGKLAPNRVRAYGPGLEPGNKVGVPAKFTVETFSAGAGTVEVDIIAPDGQTLPAAVKSNNDRNKTYSCQYVPKMEGHHRVTVKFAGKEVPKSPFDVDVRGYAGDASKVTAKGPGLEPTGNQIGKPTWFEVFTKGAGDGVVEVVIMDTSGRKDTVVPNLKQMPDGVWRVDYTPKELGLHSVNVFFAGKPIPNSPFGVKVGPVSDARKVRCTGRGLQKNGVRVRDVADFKVWTEGAGEGKLEVKVIGPGGVAEPFDMKKIDATTYEYKYYPKTPGRYTVIVQYGGQEVPKSPFEVNVGKYITSKVRAFGPGLEGGVVGHSADFCVEMNGETAPLGFSIEGPSQAKIDCKDNGDQTADVKYWPTMPGEYAVHVLANDEDIPNSPFMAQITQMPPGVNPDKVKVFGPGVEPEGVQTGRPTEFTIDCREAGKAPLHVSIMDIDYNPVNVTVRDMQDGTYKCTYTATRSVKHTVSVQYAGVGVPKSPFRVFVQEPTNPGKVRVYGPGVELGVRTATPTHFTVDCAHAGPGDVQIALQNDKGQDVPFKINDNRDGTFTVEYTAPTPGTYKVTVHFAGKEVPQSPIKVQVAAHIDVSGIRVEGLEPTVPVNSKQQIRVISTAKDGISLDEKNTTVEITTASKKTIPVKLTKGPDGKTILADFVPTELGENQLLVKVGGVPAPNQPQKFTVSPNPDPSKVKCEGPGLISGEVGVPAKFRIDTRKAGVAPLNTTIDGPQPVKIDTVDNKDGTVDVTYHPVAPGEYAVNVTFGGKPVPGVPFKPKITSKIDVSGIRVEGLEKSVPVNSKQQIRIVQTDAKAPNLNPKDIIAEITTASKKIIPVTLTATPDGRAVLADFVPTEVGENQLVVKVGGAVIPNQPQKFQVSPNADPSKVKVEGPGLIGGEVGVPAKFRIDTRKAGVAPVGMNIDGPAEVKIDTVDNKDGTIDVTYHPTAPGEYLVNVTFNQKPVPGVPFKPKITSKIDVSGIRIEGLDQTVPVNSRQQIRIVQTDQKAPPFDIKDFVSDITTASKKTVPVKLTPGPDGRTIIAEFTATEVGENQFNVKVGGAPVPKTPQKFQVSPQPDPSKVIVSGPGLTSGEVGVPAKFRIDSRKAGVAPLGLNIDGPGEVKIDTVDNKDGTVDVTYHPTAPGEYLVNVTFNQKTVPGVPFKPKITSKIDVSGIRIEGLDQTVPVNSRQQIKIVQTDQKAPPLDIKEILSEISTASKKTIAVKLTPGPDGRSVIAEFVPSEVGENQLNVKVGGAPIPKTPQKFQVSPQPDPSKVVVSGPGLTGGEVGVPAKFRIDSRKAGVAPLGLNIDGPAEVKIETVDNKDGTVDVTYHPTAPGEYLVNVTFNQKPVPGVPFKPKIASKIDVSGIKVEGLDQSVPVNSRQQIKIIQTDQKAPPLDIKEITADITTASKKTLPIKLTPGPDGRTVIAEFIPSEVGENLLNVRVGGAPIPKTPQKFQVSPQPDPSKVVVSGPGITSGEVGAPAKFRIDSRKAGVAPLGLTIDGPAEAKIETVDNKDGTIDVTYHPIAPGEYVVDVKFDNKPVPGVPFKPKIASKIDVSGIRVEGLDQTVPVNSRQQIKIVQTDQKAPPLDIKEVVAEIVTASKRNIPVKLTPAPDGRAILADFIPSEIGENVLNVKVGGVPIPQMPQKFAVSPMPDPSKVVVSGPGLTGGEAGQPATFRIDSRKAGVAPLALNIDGPAEAKIETVDNKDGTVDVTYHPVAPGEYNVNVLFNQKPVPGVPFKPKIGSKIDLSGVKIEGLDQTVPVNSRQQIRVVQTDQKAAPLEIKDMVAEILTASKKTIPVKLTPSPDGNGILADFIPAEVGESQLVVKVQGAPVPQTPKKFAVSPLPDPTKVVVTGSGLTTGEAGVPAKFRIDSRKAGVAPLGLNIDGPGEVKIDTVDNKDGTVDVTYLPTAPGEYAVNVSFNQRPVPGAPFKPKIASKIDVSGIKVEGLDQNMPVNSHQQIKVISTDQKVPLKIDEVVAEITTANNKKVPVKLTPTSDGKAILIDFIPSEVGENQLVVKVSNTPIPKMPQKFTVSPTPDASKVKVEGPGVVGGEAGVPAKFRIDTRKAGVAPLAVTVDGPEKVKIDTVDNKDGTVDVTYVPPVAGDYAVNVKFADKPVPGSPFKPKIASKIDVSSLTAEGLEETVPINSRQQVRIGSTDKNFPALNARDVTAEVLTATQKKIPVKVSPAPDGKGVLVDFIPNEAGDNQLLVKVGNQPIPKQPQKFKVSPQPDPLKVVVTGPGLQGGETGVPATFRIDTRKAGVAPLGVAIDGPKEAKINTVDNKDGTIDVTYLPTAIGSYDVNVLFNQKPVPGAPFKAKVTPKGGAYDLSGIKVEGLDQTMPIHSRQQVKIATTNDKHPHLEVQETVAEITSAAGKKIPVRLTPTPDGKAVMADFVPTEVGENQLVVSVGGQPIPNQPQKFTVSPTPDPSKVKVEGPGLKHGEVGVPARFRIDSRKAGVAPVGLGINGPAEAKIETVDNKDGTVDVVYHPVEPGLYDLNVTFAGQPVNGTPFKAQVVPKGGPLAGPDVSGIKILGPGTQGAFLDSMTEFTVDARSVTRNGEGKVKVIVTSPSGIRTEALVSNKQDGTYTVDYSVFEEGKHTLEITYEGIPVPGSPYKVNAVRGSDSTKCKAYGPGLQGGYTHITNQFTVETKGAGTGGLALAIEGPSEARMTCKDNRDGTCLVDYTATEAGEYDITIKFADKHIPGSPFKVHIDNPVDSSRVRAYGPGVEPNKVRANVPANFKIDATKSGRAPVAVDVTSDRGPVGKRPEIYDNGDGTFDVSYIPPPEGSNCKVRVTHGGKDIPGSPFQTRVLPTCEPQKVVVSGPGVNKSGVPASRPTEFIVDTKEAGYGDFRVNIAGPDGRPVKTQIEDLNDGTYKVRYVPDDLGTYNINVMYGNEPVKGAPFQIKTYPTGDASKVKILEGVHEQVVINQEYRITVNTMQAGVGNVTCKVTGEGQDFAVDIQDNGDGTISLFYTMKQQGDYTINVKFGGQPVPGGTFKVKATTEEIITQRTVERTTTRKYRSLELKNIPLPPGGGSLSGLVIMPSGKQAQPELADNKDGTVTVRYQPTEAGQHEMHVKYANQHVQGSPFKFFVDQIETGNVTAYGPGLTHGNAGEPSHFTINTRDAGSGGLSVAVEGPSKADITCVDNKDGTCNVSYLPVLPGEYKIIVKFADKHIMGSPFTAHVTGAGKRMNQISVGTASEISLMVQETDVRNLLATIKTPSGLEEPCMLKLLPNGHLGISFTPREVGEHQVIVTRNGKPIQGSPFKVSVGDKEVGNASRVKVNGNAVKEGKTNVVNEFSVDTKQAGYGGLSVSIEGPSKADIQCTDGPDGTLKVGYKPTEPGNYSLNVRFADQHVQGSPFNVKVTGEGARIQMEKITHTAQTIQTSHVGANCELQLKLPGSDPFDMKAQVTSPSGKTEDAELIDLNDSTYKVRFVPTEMGVHTISVKHKSMHIPGSPFQFTVGPLKDGGPHRVRAGGPGLERGEVGEQNDFNVWTREAGAGNLSIAVEGPSKAQINFKDHKDGSCYVAYKVDQAGEYAVAIKYNDVHIPDSPFKVHVAPSIGEGKRIEVGSMAQNLPPQKPVAFTVNMHGVKGKLTASVVNPNGKEEECVITPVDDGVYAVRFMPYEPGVYMIHVKYNGAQIRGSPFRMRIGKEEADPAQVVAYGKGLETVQTGEKAEFIVNTSKAGAGTLAVTIDGPSKVSMDCSEVDEGYKIRYTPLAPGDYFIAVKYNNAHIAGSPFRVASAGKGRGGSVVEKMQPSAFKQSNSVVVETVVKSETATKVQHMSSALAHGHSDASKVTAKGPGLDKAYQNKQNTFNVKAETAGHNVLLVGVFGQQKPAEEVHVKHVGHDSYQVSYLLKERGEYLLIVKYGDDHIPGSPFLVHCA